MSGAKLPKKSLSLKFQSIVDASMFYTELISSERNRILVARFDTWLFYTNKVADFCQQSGTMDGYGWHVTWMIRNPSPDSVLHVTLRLQKEGWNDNKCSPYGLYSEPQRHLFPMQISKFETAAVKR